MNTLTVLFVVAFLLGACSPSKSSDTFAPSHASSPWLDGIIGGTPVAPNELIAKNVALLLNSDLKRAMCTVTILSNEYAITAAHCVELYREQALLLAFGHEFRKTTPIRQVIMARTLDSRPGREAKIFDTRDLALIKFTGGLPPGYQPVQALPFDDLHILKAGAPVTLAGYGVTQYDGSAVAGPPRIDTLRKTEVLIWNPAFSGTELLVDQRQGKGACKGDSGGPAFVYFKGQMYFWGVASRGVLENGSEPPSDECSHFVVYTNAIKLLTGLATQKTSRTH